MSRKTVADFWKTMKKTALPSDWRGPAAPRYGVALIVVFLVVISSPNLTHAAATAEELNAAVATGITYFQELCATQQTLVEDLADAIEQGLGPAKRAYVLSRPPYEQIEVLANVFGDLDGQIDARPYAWDLGELDENWLGFHPVERALYRDENLTTAAVFTERLATSVDDLCEFLMDLNSFTPELSFEGLLALAVEVPSKKISSEEEAWSDQSWLIFRENYKGIWSQFSPFLSLLEEDLQSSLNTAYTEVKDVINDVDPNNGFGSSGAAILYSEVSIASRAQLQVVAYEFYLLLDAAAVELGLTGEAAAARVALGAKRYDDSIVVRQDSDSLSEAADKGRLALLEQCRLLEPTVEDLVTALGSGDLEKSQMVYLLTRPSYEQIEILAVNFPAQDMAIDARPDAYDLGEIDPEWKGVHAIERALYRDGNVSAAIPFAAMLQEVVEELCGILEDDSGDNFGPSTTWEGILALSLEITSKKISSEEETFSDLSLLIFRENWKGVWSQYSPFAGLLPEALQQQIQTTYDNFQQAYTTVLDPDNGWNGTTFRPYSEVPNSERKIISDMSYELFLNMQAAYNEIIGEEGGDDSESSSDQEEAITSAPDSTEDSDSSEPETEETADPDGAVPSTDSEDDDDDGVCFAASSTVMLDNGHILRMDVLKVGDRVQVGPGRFAPVIGFSHRVQNVKAKFVRIHTTAPSTITMSRSHYLVLPSGQLKNAGSISTGDYLLSANGQTVIVDQVDEIVSEGLYAPHTSSFGEQLVVDEIVASEYTTRLDPLVASILLAPFRLLYPIAGGLLQLSPIQALVDHCRSAMWRSNTLRIASRWM